MLNVVAELFDWQEIASLGNCFATKDLILALSKSCMVYCTL